MDMRADAKLIYTRAIDAALPDNAVRAALKDIELQGNIYVPQSERRHGKWERRYPRSWDQG